MRGDADVRFDLHGNGLQLISPLSTASRDALSQGIVDGLLETDLLCVHLFLQPISNVRIDRHGRSHAVIIASFQ